MKKVLLIVIALCFVFACNFETYSQKRKIVKKPVKRKLVKCRVNGKIVYRTRCRIPRLVNPDIQIYPSTQGSRTDRTPDDPYGMVRTEGSGQGGGEGNGIGYGRGSGQGNGMGSGLGSGNIEPETTVTPESRIKPTGITQGVKIISKPRATYTDAARQNQVQGKVVLRVTFSANGSIGAISIVNGLPNGLTEQAIAAARGIRFEPAMKNGVPYTIVRNVEFSFTMY